MLSVSYVGHENFFLISLRRFCKRDRIGLFRGLSGCKADELLHNKLNPRQFETNDKICRLHASFHQPSTRLIVESAVYRIVRKPLYNIAASYGLSLESDGCTGNRECCSINRMQSRMKVAIILIVRNGSGSKSCNARLRHQTRRQAVKWLTLYSACNDWLL